MTRCHALGAEFGARIAAHCLALVLIDSVVGENTVYRCRKLARIARVNKDAIGPKLLRDPADPSGYDGSTAKHGLRKNCRKCLGATRENKDIGLLIQCCEFGWFPWAKEADPPFQPQLECQVLQPRPQRICVEDEQ